jgi:hypothetical protein
VCFSPKNQFRIYGGNMSFSTIVRLVGAVTVFSAAAGIAAAPAQNEVKYKGFESFFETKDSAFVWWLKGVKRGQAIERSTCPDFCDREWTEQTGLSPNPTSKVYQQFIKDCSQDCYFAKRLIEGSYKC